MKMIHASSANSTTTPRRSRPSTPTGQPEGLTGWTAVLRLRLGDMGVESRKDLTKRQAGDLIDWLEAQEIPFPDVRKRLRLRVLGCADTPHVTALAPLAR
jgi:hypothetical protein